MPYAMTASGPVPVEDLGLTLMHEHVLIDVRCYWDPATEADARAPDRPVTMDLLGRVRRDPVGVTRQNLILDSVEDAIGELAAFKKAGGKTIVDLTPRGTGPRTADVAVAAAAAGVAVVFGTGYYLEHTQPGSVVDAPRALIIEQMLSDFDDGFDGTGIRAGVIGEIGTSDPIRPTEKKVLRAAATAQRETGAALNVHLAEWGSNGPALLDLIEGEGGNLDRVILSHLDSRLDISYHAWLAERGAYIEYDLFGTEEYRVREGRFNPTDRERAVAVCELMERGLGRRILISTDVCTKAQLRRYGGYGYDHIPTNVVPMLRQAGLGQSTIDLLLRDNPARLLSLG